MAHYLLFFFFFLPRINGIKVETDQTNLGRVGRVRFVEEGPDFRFSLLPPRQLTGIVGLLEAEFTGQLFIARFVRVQVESIEHGQGFLRVTMLWPINVDDDNNNNTKNNRKKVENKKKLND